MMKRLKSGCNYLIKNVNENSYHLKDILLAATTLSVLYYGHQKIVSNSKRARYRKEALLKKALLTTKKHKCLELYNKLIKPETSSLILSMSATEIREYIIANKINCASVMLIIINNTHKCNKKLNAILEKHYDAAYNDAIELDKLIASKRNSNDWLNWLKTKQLLGIPVSIKDLFIMKNSDSTCGIIKLCNKPFNYNGSIIKLIISHGGIPYIKTNVPQLNMLPETINNIIGKTNNPYNINRVSGGSSGGEAALISCNASKLGIGSDIGGSLRSPAHFCGCIAYKPSSKRSPQTGKGLANGNFYVNKFGIRASQGPLATHMDDIIRLLKLLWNNAEMIDPYMMPLSFRDNIFNSKKKLKIGYWYDDGWFTSTKCVKRGIDQVLNVLKNKYNYDIVPIPFNNGLKVLEIYFNYMGAESKMSDYLRKLDDCEELFHGFKKLRQYQLIPALLRNYVIKPLLKYILNEPRKCKLLSLTKNRNLTIREYRDLCLDIMKFKYEFWRFIDKYNVDCIVTATNFYPAPKHNFSTNFTPTLTSTFLQNILDCSAGNYGPVAFVNKNECGYDLNDLPLNQRDSISKELNEYMKDAYGLPIGVQIFSKPYNDEVVLRVMNDLDIYYKQNKIKNKGKLITDQD